MMKTIAFIKNLIANNGENSDPIDINPLTLAVDDGAGADGTGVADWPGPGKLQ
ncbi:hypothetical protein LP417_25225 [Polaromonas sp. P1-6]|nr:hypothetical protein LP417_25225 [Polaromonas sp. P1-6]